MSKKVIIIDDSLTSLNVIKTAFAAEGWEVYGAQNAQNIIKLVYDIVPDLIITDAVMPIMGGFQVLKVIRQDPKISKIPVIVYSILDEKNSKFYIKKEFAEFYLKKDETPDQLLKLAGEVVKKYPISDEYKYEILKSNVELDNFIEHYVKPTETPTKPPLKFENVEARFKEKYDFTRSDDRILSDVFAILYPLLEYDLAVICIDSFEKNEKTVYFDIRDIILSPIFQNSILHNLSAKNSFLFKKYAPSLKVITNEEEFLTKIKFDFEHNEKTIADVIFYSKDKSKWMNNSDIEIIKKTLDNFFKARFVNKSSMVPKNNEISNKYFIDRLDFKFDAQNKKEMYVAIIEIYNIKELQDTLAPDDLDFINSKISEKLINFVSDNEQVYKNDEGEYVLVFFAKDKEDANQKLNWIIDLLNEVSVEEEKIEVVIGACNCKINNQFNFHEAQKLARSVLENVNTQNRIIIYDTK